MKNSLESSKGNFSGDCFHAASMEQLFNLCIKSILHANSIEGTLGMEGLGYFFPVEYVEKVSRYASSVMVGIIPDTYIDR